MTESSFERWFAGAVLVSVVGAVMAVVETNRVADATAANREFQQLVGGLGMGPATELWTCSAAFDPRISNTCDRRYEPIPVGNCFCPAHLGDAFATSGGDENYSPDFAEHASIH